MKILNLYAGIGGNRRLWKNVDVTAVEYNPDIAAIYKDFFPDDNVIIGDAHNYLLENFNNYDFIWTSPPCPTHSQYRYYVGVKAKGYKPVYPDMTLYQEIILLKHHFKGFYCVENVRPYYKPLIEPQKIGRHFIWSNFYIPPYNYKKEQLEKNATISKMEKLRGISLTKYKINNKRLLLRNCTDSHLGLHILNSIDGILPSDNYKIKRNSLI